MKSQFLFLAVSQLCIGIDIIHYFFGHWQSLLFKLSNFYPAIYCDRKTRQGAAFTIPAIFFTYKRVTKGNFHMARFRLASQLPNQNRTFVTAGAPFVCNAWMDTRMICNIWSTKTSSFNAPSTATGVVIQTEMY